MAASTRSFLSSPLVVVGKGLKLTHSRIVGSYAGIWVTEPIRRRGFRSV
jgi:hypothetical protein